MIKHGPKLEREQVLLGRFVEIGAELFAITATCSRANSIAKQNSGDAADDTLRLADYFCESARLRIERNFDGLTRNTDRAAYKVAQTVLNSDLKELNDGIVRTR
jgi:hypothetical protein